MCIAIKYQLDAENLPVCIYYTCTPPGQKVKDEIIPAVVEECHFISKLSYDCLYYYATAKADVRVPSLGLKEYQFRDLLL